MNSPLLKAADGYQAAPVHRPNGWGLALKFRLQMMWVLALNEVRLRTRRISSLVAIMAMIGLCWAMIVDPRTGSAFIVINHARVLYTSSALAMGSSSTLCVLMALIAFYLVRGRIGEDIRSGIGSVIAATPVSNSVFIFSRWLGGVAYISVLIFVFMLSMMVLQLVRGDGAIEPGVYLLTYALVLLPMAFYAIGMAILFDSIPFLMGKAGDVLYFILWILQVSLVSKIEELGHHEISVWFLLDFSGLISTVHLFQTHLLTKNVSMGVSSFDASLAPIVLPSVMWNLQMVGMRVLSGLIAMLALVPAIPFFHRYSPDKIKQTHSRKRRSPFEILNGWTRPFSKLMHPVMRLSAALPGIVGQVLAEMALSLVNAPFAILAMIVLNFVGLLTKQSGLSGVATIAFAFWGVLIADISTRDYQANLESMTGSVRGGGQQRLVRQFAASVALGLLFVAPVLMRWSAVAPQLAIGGLVGIVSMSALAAFLGKTSRTPRTFMSLYLFWLYIATQTPQSAMLDALAFNGAANWASIMLQIEIAVAAIVMVFLYERFRIRS